MFGKKKVVENSRLLETPEQFNNRIKKEKDQSLKISSVDFALKFTAGFNMDVDHLIKSSKKIYEFISK